MMRNSFTSFGLLILLAVPAGALSIEPPSCFDERTGKMNYIFDVAKGPAVLFSEESVTEVADPGSIVLLHCPSGQATRVNPDNWQKQSDAFDTLTEVANSQVSFTRKEIRKRLKHKGVASKAVNYRVNHCTCSNETLLELGFETEEVKS